MKIEQVDYNWPREWLSFFRMALKYCNTDGQDGLTWIEIQDCAVKRIKIIILFKRKWKLF